MTRELWFRSNGDPETRFLSNFYPCRIELRVGPEVLMGHSAEHLYQALKQANPADRTRVLNARSAVDAMWAGRRGQLRPDWDAEAAMRDVLRAKFARSSLLAERLMKTASYTLIENNRGPWGGRDGGENRLGKLLMELREELLENEP